MFLGVCLTFTLAHVLLYIINGREFLTCAAANSQEAIWMFWFHFHFSRCLCCTGIKNLNQKSESRSKWKMFPLKLPHIHQFISFFIVTLVQWLLPQHVDLLLVVT